MKTIFRAGPCGIALLAFSAALGAQTPSSTDNTLTYPAAYFAEFGSVSVNDMLNRIPGIDLALGGNQVPSVNNANDRGLGAEGQIMVNGKRLAGKANETRAQLDRIAASGAAIGFSTMIGSRLPCSSCSQRVSTKLKLMVS